MSRNAKDKVMQMYMPLFVTYKISVALLRVPDFPHQAHAHSCTTKSQVYNLRTKDVHAC